MKDKFKEWKRWVPAVLAAAIWLISARAGREVEAHRLELQFRGRTGTSVIDEMTFQNMTSRIENSTGLFSFAASWSDVGLQEVENPHLSRRKEAACIVVSGDKSLVVSLKLVSGSFGTSVDRDGCLISRSMAVFLFGSTNVSGKRLNCMGQSWIIRGVFDSSAPLVALSAQSDGRQSYENLIFRFPSRGGQSTSYAADRLKLKYHIGEAVMVDGSLWAGAARLFYMVPLWVLAACFLRLLWKSGMPGSRVFFAVSGCAVYGALAWLSFRLPGDFIPGRWSDISFWAVKIQDIAQTAVRIAKLPSMDWDIRIKTAFLICVLSGAASMFLCLCIFRGKPGKSKGGKVTGGKTEIWKS